MDQEGKISPMPNASDVGAREASWLPTTIEIGAVSITEKGEANGIATLNSQGRLVPDARCGRRWSASEYLAASGL